MHKPTPLPFICIKGKQFHNWFLSCPAWGSILCTPGLGASRGTQNLPGLRIQREFLLNPSRRGSPLPNCICFVLLLQHITTAW